MKLNVENLYKRRPKRDMEYDVIVAGGGPAAIGASLAAAMNGAKVLILESRSQFGGTATAAMWMNFNYMFKDNEHTDRGGVNRLLAQSLEKWGKVAAVHGKREPSLCEGGNLSIHPEYLKKILFDLFEEYEVDYQLYSQVVDVIKEGNVLRGVVACTKEGLVTYKGKIIVDASGDGDVAYYAGCTVEDTNPETAWRAPITLCFALGNVDEEKFYSWFNSGHMELEGKVYTSLNQILEFAFNKGYFVPDWIGLDHSTIPNILCFNNGTSRNIFLDGTSSYDLTLVEKLGAEETLEFIRFAKDYKLPGLEDPYLMRTGSYAAVRETRRLVGEYVFTNDDLLNGYDFPDGIASKYGGRDPVGEDHPVKRIKQGTLYPYRSLLPKDVDGLLVAGRCGSATFLGHYGGKSMGNMMAIGQAAGVAAAICARTGNQPRKLDYKLIQEKLAEMGVSL